MENMLTPKQKKAVQYIATTSNVLLHRNRVGISPDKLKSFLGIKSNKELDTFVDICNLSLKEEVVPAKIIYDDVLGVYVYLQTAEPSVIVERINSKSMLLLMLLYYNQQVLGKEFTLTSELQEIVDATVTENNNSKIKNALDPLLQYCLIVEKEQGYRVTKVGDAFLTPILLNRATNIVMEKNYSLGAVLEFFRRNIPSKEEPQFISGDQIGIL